VAQEATGRFGQVTLSIAPAAPSRRERQPSCRGDPHSHDVKGMAAGAHRFDVYARPALAHQSGQHLDPETRRHDCFGRTIPAGIGENGEGAALFGILDRKAALARLVHGSKAGILLNEPLAEDGALVFEHACKLGAEGIVSKRVDAPYRSGAHPAWVKVRNPASIAVQRERSENWNK